MPSSFESKLERLSYRAPALVAAMLEDSGLEPSKRLDVLDAGCGTGLCGPLVAPYARRLVGVDLSEGMLAHAKEKNVYDALMKAELTDYLQRQQRSLRPDRVGGHAGVFRRSAKASSLPPPERCARMGCSYSRSSTRSEARRMSTTAWSCTAAIVTPAPT